MRPTRWLSPALTAAALLLAIPAPAQVATESYVEVRVNPYGGVFAFDNGGIEAAGAEVDIAGIAGGRVVIGFGERWQVEGGYGFSPLTIEASEFADFPEPELDRDVNAHLFYGAVGLMIGSEVAPTKLLLTAGVGGLALDPEEGESDTDFLVTLGAGFTHPINDWIRFRGDFRDHITFCEAPARLTDPTSCVEDETLNNIEVSGGLEFRVY